MQGTTAPLDDDGQENSSDNWRKCAVCTREFRITEREKTGLDFLKGHHRSGEDNAGDFRDAPLFGDRGLCMECVEEVLKETSRNELLTLVNEMEDFSADKKDLIRNSLDPRGRVGFLEDRGLLPMVKGLRQHSFRGMGEELLLERLPAIEDHIRFLFSDFPGIEENEFFRHEMKELFSDPAGYLTPIKADRVRTKEEEMLRPDILMEKLDRDRARKQ